MQADDFILKLPNTPFKTKEGLPKHPGIYYVVDDQTQEILYIGQSVNINSRWLGRGHHREHQLTSLRRSRRTTLTIYHEYVKLELLDITEQQRIHQYSPLLNDSPVKIRKTIPAEQLLVDSLEILREDILVPESYWWFSRKEIVEVGSYVFSLRHRLKPLEGEPLN